MFLFTLLPTLFVLSSAIGLGETELQAMTTGERRRGYGAVFCWGICTGACAIGTGGIGFPTPAGWLCETVCVGACTASTACFDENAEVRTFDEATGDLVTVKISEFATKDVNPEVQTATFLGDGTHLRAATETLDAVVAIEGDWKFYEITTSTVALNTTDDHGWIVVDSDGSDGCVVHAAEVKVGDYVLVFPEDSFKPTVAKVTFTRSFRLPVKYAVYTDSGLLVANGMLTTVFCDHDSNDCAANLTLKERLDVWKARHAEQVQEGKKLYPGAVGRLMPEQKLSKGGLSQASVQDEIDELRMKVDKVQNSLRRFKRKVADQLDN